jgi:hypothetical protein
MKFHLENFMKIYAINFIKPSMLYAETRALICAAQVFSVYAPALIGLGQVRYS